MNGRKVEIESDLLSELIGLAEDGKAKHYRDWMQGNAERSDRGRDSHEYAERVIRQAREAQRNAR